MKEMKEKIRVAFIGCGRFCKFFVPLFKVHPAVEKVYVCDLIRERAEKFSADYGVEIIDSLEEAILAQKKVIFLYFDLDENGRRVYRRGGHHYVVEPVALVFNEDNYYVMTYSSRHESTATYRLDRMEAVSVIEEPICDKAVELRREMAQYTEQVFKMYGGQPEDVVLEFQDGLIGVVFDKFGEDTPMMRVGESKCVATVKVRISPTFWGWLFQFAGEMRVLSPQWVIDGYRQQAKKLEE